LRLTHRTLLPLVVCAFTLPAFAAVQITSFEVESFNNFRYDVVLNSSFTPNTATITNTTITCDWLADCNAGIILNYQIAGTGFSNDAKVSIDIDGSLSGEDEVQGLLTVNAAFGGQPGAIGTDVDFFITPGQFSKTLLSPIVIPAAGDGTFTVFGYLTLDMVDGQTLSLPDSLVIRIEDADNGGGEPGAVPEPMTMSLFAGGLATLAVSRKKLRK
jgi:hypothetical protein